MARRHLIIPDAQIKPGQNLDHIDWAAKAIVEYRPDVIVVIGDWWDMSSLSTHEAPGSKEAEGRRVKPDIDAGNEAFERLITPINAEITRLRSNHKKRWEPECHFLFGNHEQRLSRAIFRDPKWEGLLTMESLKTPGFKRHEFLDIANIDGIKYCLHPKHRVLTNDLRYVSLGDVKCGQKLLAFDEYAPDGKARLYKTAVVKKVDADTAQLYRVTLASGKQFDVTSDHRWLVRNHNSTSYRWVQTSDLRPKVSCAIRLFDEWDETIDKEAGWLAGLFDGEGCLSKPNSKQGGIHLSFSQNDGLVLRKAKALLTDMGYAYTENRHAECRCVRIGGPSSTKLEFLGRIRPERLIAKFQPEMLGRVQAPAGFGSDGVVNVSRIGKGEIVRIETSTGTLIADGYAHHNCHYFPNPFSGKPIGGTIVNRLNHIGGTFVQGHQQGFMYASKQYPDHVKHGIVCGRFYLTHEHYRPQDVQKSEWNGILVLNQVKDGDFDLMPLRMEYLKRKYG